MTARSEEPRQAPSEAAGDIPREGDIIAGRYRVERVLGKGGMGVVVAARHTSLRQRVAVKFLRPGAMRLPGASERFLREAQAAASLQSEHVARVTDVGTLASGSPFMVMEYLTGTDLSQALKAHGPLPVAEAVDYVLQACEALAEAHKLGIIHRDLKPGNIFLTSHADGSPLIKVLDFGLSKVIREEGAGVDGEGGVDSSLTATDMVVGSPHYMSPEQMRSLKHVDARTDIWSMGVILYQLLTTRRPFEGDSLPAVFLKIAADPPDSLRAHRPDVPEELERAVMRCLEKDLSLRFQSVAELARAIAPFGPDTSRVSAERIERVLPEGSAASLKRVSGPTGLVVVVSDEPTTAQVSTWAQTKVRARRGAAFALAAGTAVAVAVVVATAILPALLDGPTGEAPSGSSTATASSEVSTGRAGAPTGVETVRGAPAVEASTALPVSSKGGEAAPAGSVQAALLPSATAPLGTAAPAGTGTGTGAVAAPGAAAIPGAAAAAAAAPRAAAAAAAATTPGQAVATARPAAPPPKNEKGNALDRWE